MSDPRRPRPDARVCALTLISAVCAPALVLLLASSAGAYEINSTLSDDCHERLTQEALLRARGRLGEVGVVRASGRDEEALLDDLPFALEVGARDLGAAALVLANRHVDLGRASPREVDRLVTLHGDPALQHEHCLRSSAHDEPAGSRQALEACRAWIRERFTAALDGLDEAGQVDPEAQTELAVYLAFRGVTDAELPTFHAELGQALHALQDGFSHTLRDEQGAVIAVLNYVELAKRELDEAVDGPPHMTDLDACGGLDDYQARRYEQAVEASTDLLVAALDPALGREQRLAALEGVLDAHLAFAESDCRAANEWCGAPENAYRDSGCACAATREAPGAPPLALLVAGLGGAALLGRARRDRRGAAPSPWRRGARAALGWTLGVALLLAPADLLAQSELDDERFSDRDVFPFGVSLDLGGTVENPALNVALGVRWRLDDELLFGLSAEWNPAYSTVINEFRTGFANFYATGVWRNPLRASHVSLRSTLNLGASMILFDLYGVPDHSVGPFVSFCLLGLDYEFSDQVYLIINPAEVAVPIPWIGTLPYAYPQYRFTIGIQVGG